jgi:hypothetical protein
MEDSICALLLLHARSLGLLTKPKALDVLKAVMNVKDLYEGRWLLAYEASVKQWLPSPATGDHLLADSNFGQLKKAGVSFYDVNMTVLPTVDDQTDAVDSFFSRLGPDYSEQGIEDTDLGDDADHDDF